MYFILMPAQINKPTQTKRELQIREQSEKRLQTGLAQLHARPSAINEAGWG